MKIYIFMRTCLGGKIAVIISTTRTTQFVTFYKSLRCPQYCNNTLTQFPSGRMAFIKHTKSCNMFRVCCNEVLLGGAYIRMFKDLFVISYKIPIFSLIQMLKFVLHILDLK